MTLTHVASLGLDHAPVTLLVDRDPDTRKVYAEFLNMSAGCDILEAEDGREALAKAISRHPDVVITETRLPGLSGFDLCALLRRDSSTSTIPVIFVTGDAFEADVKRAERAGADAVLTKPCLPEQLLKEIRRVLQHSRELRARGAEAREQVHKQLTRSEELIERSHANLFKRRVILSRAHHRRDTTEPPTAPPALICPNCDQPLKYLRSHVGGVSARHAEQWDYYECAAGCGTFQYRERTRKLRKV
jgi:two-component system, cell cycle response regulator DivK